MIEKWVENRILYKLEHYKGTLNFPCDFCDSNSYDNIHITIGGLLIVVCENCIKKVF